MPIYKVAYDFLDVTTDMAKNMNRHFKRSLGEKLNSEGFEILVLIFRANVARDKTAHLDTLIERIQVAELLLRLACDKKLISIGQFAAAIALTSGIGRQAGGWRRNAASPAA